MILKPSASWYQFSLWTLLIAIVPICALLAWWVSYSLNWISGRHEVLGVYCNAWRMGPLISPPGALWLFGEFGVSVLDVQTDDASEFERLNRLFPESRGVVLRTRTSAKAAGILPTVP